MTRQKFLALMDEYEEAVIAYAHKGALRPDSAQEVTTEYKLYRNAMITACHNLKNETAAQPSYQIEIEPLQVDWRATKTIALKLLLEKLEQL